MSYLAKDVPLRTIFIIGFATLMGVIGWLTWKAEASSERSIRNQVVIESVDVSLKDIRSRLIVIERKVDRRNGEERP